MFIKRFKSINLATFSVKTQRLPGPGNDQMYGTQFSDQRVYKSQSKKLSISSGVCMVNP